MDGGSPRGEPWGSIGGIAGPSGRPSRGQQGPGRVVCWQAGGGGEVSPGPCPQQDSVRGLIRERRTYLSVPSLAAAVEGGVPSPGLFRHESPCDLSLCGSLRARWEGWALAGGRGPRFCGEWPQWSGQCVGRMAVGTGAGADCFPVRAAQVGWSSVRTRPLALGQTGPQGQSVECGPQKARLAISSRARPAATGSTRWLGRSARGRGAVVPSQLLACDGAVTVSEEDTRPRQTVGPKGRPQETAGERGSGVSLSLLSSQARERPLTPGSAPPEAPLPPFRHLSRAELLQAGVSNLSQCGDLFRVGGAG